MSGRPLDTLLSVTDRPLDELAPRTLVVDEELRAAMALAVRVLEEQVAAARASARFTGSAAPEVHLYSDAADRLRAAVAE